MNNNKLLFDGAMGTLYAKQTGNPSWHADLCVLENPEIITDIHREYMNAGAKALKTCTFSLPQQYVSDPKKARELLKAAVRCAKEAAKDSDVVVFGDLGPVDEHCHPAEIYPVLADWMEEEGVKAILFETQSSTEGLPEAFSLIKEKHPDLFLLASFAAAADGLSSKGIPAGRLLAEMDACKDVDAIGLNCLCGPAHMFSIVRELPAYTKPLSIMPNAGYPTISARAALYDGTPDYFARQMEKIARAGASIVGGCCGTEPAHIKALAERLAKTESFESAPADPEEGRTKRRKEPGVLDENLAKGIKSILVELDPPADDHIAPFFQGAARLQAAGADLLTIADNPIGRPRADSSILACKIRRELGMEVLPHMTCRDRNLNAIKALLIGLSMEDVHHVLLVTGDPLPSQTRDEVKAVFSFHSRTLAGYVRQLEEEGICQPFHAFAALDLNARNFDVQMRIAHEKEENGIEGFLTQPIFSKRAAENLRRARKELQGKIYAGLMPIVSERNALFLKNEISGMDIPDELAAKYAGKNREECEEISLETLCTIAEEVFDDCDGYYLMTPFRRIELMEQLIGRIKEMESRIVRRKETETA